MGHFDDLHSWEANRTKRREEELLEIFILIEENKEKSTREAIKRFKVLKNIKTDAEANVKMRQLWKEYVKPKGK